MAIHVWEVPGRMSAQNSIVLRDAFCGVFIELGEIWFTVNDSHFI
jgi:hypothetical protein